MNIQEHIIKHNLEEKLEKYIQENNPSVPPDQIRALVAHTIDLIQELSKNDRLDTILEKIQQGILADKLGLISFFIKTLQTILRNEHTGSNH